MPSSWSSLTPFLAIKRSLTSHKKESNNKKEKSPSSPLPLPSISSPLPITLSSPSTPRFSRRDQLPTRTRKYLLTPSTPQSSSSTLPHSTPTRKPTVPTTQPWPTPDTLLQWMEPCLPHPSTVTHGTRSSTVTRVRTRSEGGCRPPSEGSFWSSESIALPTRCIVVDRRTTGEKVAAWIRSRSSSRERISDNRRINDNEDEDNGRLWSRCNSERRYYNNQRCNRPLPPVPPPRSRSIDTLHQYSMPAAAGCSNCFTKYSLLNREEGCTGCALSFCKKCVGWKAIVPGICNTPVSVCRSCFERLEKEKKAKESTNVVVTSTPLYPQVWNNVPSNESRSFFERPNPSNPIQSTSSESIPPPPSYSQVPSSSSSIYPSMGSNRPWWSYNDLPPPSMRAELGKGVVYERPFQGMRSTVSPPTVPPPSYSQSLPMSNTKEKDDLSELEERVKKLKDDSDAPIPSISSLEERLAALRGCDVELIRNPRSYYARSQPEPRGDTVAKLMEEAASMAILEEKNDPDRLLEERVKRLMDHKEEKKDDDNDKDQVRLSVAPSVSSHMSEVSDATKEELADIDRLMKEAKKRVEEAEGKVIEERRDDDLKGEEVDREMNEADKLAKQVSMDVEKVNAEMADFWMKQNVKRGGAKRKDSSSEEELDDETIENIVREAENTPDEPVAVKHEVRPSESSPDKKKSIFGRMFKK